MPRIAKKVLRVAEEALLEIREYSISLKFLRSSPSTLFNCPNLNGFKSVTRTHLREITEISSTSSYLFTIFIKRKANPLEQKK